MPRLSVFNSVSLDGYFTDAHGDMSWAHRADDEWNAFAAENAGGGGVLLFGRVTYEQMAAFWPTPAAFEAMPAVADRMTALRKIVFSTTLEQPPWANTEVIRSDLESTVQRLKQEPGPDLVVLGSGTIVSQLTDARLIDEYQVVVTPVVLGSGRTMFDGVRETMDLRLTGTRVFGNGNVVLRYELVP